MELVLGPVLFEWKRDEVKEFYKKAADMDLDRVYVGEVVCSKKRGLRVDDIGGIIELLESAGKVVTLSSLAVISNDEELEYTRRVVGLHNSVEANDISVLAMVNAGAREVTAGPHITSYNAPSVEFLKDLGISRVTFPVELGRASISHVIEETGITGEVFAHGRVPLAFSWRCYSSRAFGLTKAECKHDCARYPEGLELKTLDDEPLFIVNGTSLLGADTYSFVEYVEDLKEIGVQALRISPGYEGTAKVVEIFRKRINGLIGPEEGAAMLREVTGARLSNGWYTGCAGKDYIAAHPALEGTGTK